VFEFDHVRGEKKAEVMKLARTGVGYARIQEEIDKMEDAAVADLLG
jgi:hypothetical protein